MKYWIGPWEGKFAIIGQRGSGKTSVGKELERQIWWGFADLDEVIVNDILQGKSISDVVANQWWYSFRTHENSALQMVVKNASTRVLSLGGGTTSFWEVSNDSTKREIFSGTGTWDIIIKTLHHRVNQQILVTAGYTSIFLHTSPQVLVERVLHDIWNENRPPLNSRWESLEEETYRVYWERTPIYREQAHFTLDTDGKRVSDIVEEILAQYPQA